MTPIRSPFRSQTRITALPARSALTGSRALAALLATTAVALGLTLAVPAQAQGHAHGQGHSHEGGAHQGQHGKMAMGHAGMGMGGMGAFAHPRMTERLLDQIQATPEQRAQVRQLLQGVQAESRADREAGRALAEQAAALFAQPTVDANAAEALRQQMLVRADTASRRMTQLMLDMSRVLTPEQRARIAELRQERREKMQQRRADRAERAAPR